MICHVCDLGLIDYQSAWDLQNKLAAEIARGERSNTLLLLEHPHTYTFGRRGKAENLLWDAEKLAKNGVAVHWVDRGGDVTYHGPGQLVGYPLMRLEGTDHVGYVRNLEKMLVAALARLGLASGQINGKTGVWVQADIASRCLRCKPENRHTCPERSVGKPAKIAAIGVKVDANGITRHGFALNVDPQMDYFDGIIPCGIADYQVISLADIFPTPPEMDAVKHEVLRAFGEVFRVEIRPISI
jgi:lipoyl(octanoyl) transferase